MHRSTEFIYLLSILLAARRVAAQNESWYWPEKVSGRTGWACSANETTNRVDCYENPAAFCLSTLDSDIDYCCTDKCLHYPILTTDNGGKVNCSGAYCASEAECVVNDGIPLCQLKLSDKSNQAIMARIKVPYTPGKSPTSASSSSPSSTSTSTSKSSPQTSGTGSPSSSSAPKGGIGVGAIAGIVAAVIVGLIALIVVGVCLHRRKKKVKYAAPAEGDYTATGGRVEMHADPYYGPKPAYVELHSEGGGGWGSKPGTPNQSAGEYKDKEKYASGQTQSSTPAYELPGNNGTGNGAGLHEMAG